MHSDSGHSGFWENMETRIVKEYSKGTVILSDPISELTPRLDKL